MSETDMFGAPIAPVESTDSSQEEEKKGEGKESSSDNEPKETQDEEIARLKTENASLTAVGVEKDNNLVAQREQLDRKFGDKGEGDKKVEVEAKDLPHPEVKFSKDLSEDDRDELTRKEIEQMDKIAEMETEKNEAFVESKQEEADEKGKKEEEKVGVKLDKVAKKEAMRLARDDKELANQIIEQYNSFLAKGDLTEAQVVERVAKATKLLPDFKPAKEQSSGGAGKPAGQAGKGDEFGNDAIIDEVYKNQSGGGFSL